MVLDGDETPRLGNHEAGDRPLPAAAYERSRTGEKSEGNQGTPHEFDRTCCVEEGRRHSCRGSAEQSKDLLQAVTHEEETKEDTGHGVDDLRPSREERHVGLLFW